MFCSFRVIGGWLFQIPNRSSLRMITECEFSTIKLSLPHSFLSSDLRMLSSQRQQRQDRDQRRSVFRTSAHCLVTEHCESTIRPCESRCSVQPEHLTQTGTAVTWFRVCCIEEPRERKKYFYEHEAKTPTTSRHHFATTVKTSISKLWLIMVTSKVHLAFVTRH